MRRMKLAASLLICIALTGCATVPTERIDAYAAAYAETRQAAEAVYGDYSAWDTARRTAEFEAKLAAETSPRKQFAMLVPKNLAEPIDTGRGVPPVVTSALAALDAGAVYNEALVGVAAGKSVAEVRDSVASVAGIIGTLGGAPWVGKIIDLVLGQIEQARSREELVASLTREVSIVVSDGETRHGHAIDLLLDLLLEHADLMFEKRSTVAKNEVRHLEIAAGDIAAARALVLETAREAAVLVEYRRLLLDTRQYFAALRQAARNPDVAAQVAESVRNAREVTVQGRLVLALMRGGM